MQQKHIFISNLAEVQDKLQNLHISQEFNPFKETVISSKLHNPSWLASYNGVPPRKSELSPTSLCLYGNVILPGKLL